MKLHIDNSSGLNLFTRYGPGFVVVNQDSFQQNLLVLPNRIQADWTLHNFEQLTEADFSLLSTLGVEILLLGTGEHLRFPTPSLQAPLISARIGLEVMTTPAACRTYNILASEGRKVAAALLI